jgi:type II secretory pathway pseudopilin PulG
MKIFPKIFGRRRSRGETLLEVIMSIFIVATGSAAATTLIVSAIQANGFSRDNLIALNLAAEGIEAVRNIRDTNWLKFGFDKENCWNMMPGKIACADPDLIAEGAYTVDLDTSAMAWLLSGVPSQPVLDLDAGSPTNNNYYQLWFINTNGDAIPHDLYVSKNIPPAQLGLINDATKFYRMVQISYNGIAKDTADEMNVTSTVQWKTQQAVHNIVLSSKLTNYQKVKVTP